MDQEEVEKLKKFALSSGGNHNSEFFQAAIQGLSKITGPNSKDHRLEKAEKDGSKKFDNVEVGVAAPKEHKKLEVKFNKLASTFEKSVDECEKAIKDFNDLDPGATISKEMASYRELCTWRQWFAQFIKATQVLPLVPPSGVPSSATARVPGTNTAVTPRGPAVTTPARAVPCTPAFVPGGAAPGTPAFVPGSSSSSPRDVPVRNNKWMPNFQPASVAVPGTPPDGSPTPVAVTGTPAVPGTPGCMPGTPGCMPSTPAMLASAAVAADAAVVKGEAPEEELTADVYAALLAGAGYGLGEEVEDVDSAPEPDFQAGFFKLDRR